MSDCSHRWRENVYPVGKTVLCTACSHPAELHRDSGCIAYFRGSDMRQPRACDCFRDAKQATLVEVRPERHLRIV